MSKKAIIIGGGFGALGSACLLAKAGWHVTVLEKNEQLGGRAGLLEVNGFKFDLGPSWYLMPEVFEAFFRQLGEDIHDYVNLVKLQPSYKVYFKDSLNNTAEMWANLQKDKATFEAIERGSGKQLEKYLKRSEYVYNTAMEQFLYKNYDSAKDFLQPKLIREAHRLSLFSNMDRYVRKYFKDQRLQQIMQYPLVFLGASPYNAPALYNLMSHVDFNQGVFYPMGGMYELVKALVKVAQKHGVEFKLNCPVEQIIVENKRAIGVRSGNKELKADVVISNADIHHTETALLEPLYRDHSIRYWNKRTLAPSALLIYLGVDRTYGGLRHHNLLFSKDWKKNFSEIFNVQNSKLRFPSDPSLYVCNPSKTDPSVAPKGHENIFVLVPLAAGLTYTDKELEDYSNTILQTIEQEMGLLDLRKHIVYKKLFCVKDFAQRFNSLKGTGLGLAHTMSQTALFRPSNKSRKVKNLYYVGANVHPGIGLPVTLISAELAYKRIINTNYAA